VALIQSNFGTPGNLEVVVRIGNRLAHLYKDSGGGWKKSNFSFDGAAGIPGFIQSTRGNKGHFEVLTPLTAGGMKHLWRDNDSSDLHWHQSDNFGNGSIDAATIIQSNFGPSGSGNLEAVARTGNCVDHYWRPAAASGMWSPSTAHKCIPQTFQILHPGYSETRGEWPLPTPGEELEITVVFNKPVNRDSMIYGSTFSLRKPNNARVSIQDLNWSSDNRVLTFKTVGNFYDLTNDGPLKLTVIGTYPRMVRPHHTYVVVDSQGEILDGDSDGGPGGNFWTKYLPWPPG